MRPENMPAIDREEPRPGPEPPREKAGGQVDAAAFPASGNGRTEGAVRPAPPAPPHEPPPPARPARAENLSPVQPGVVPLLKRVVAMGASDLHLKPMRPPLVRVNGRLAPLEGDPLDPGSLETLLEEILNERQRNTLAKNLQVDFGYSVAGLSRFRATVFYQRSTLAGVFRRIPFEFPSLEEWGLPPVLKELCRLQRGLVLVTGPTGAGKSSTLAAMIREIAASREDHVVTIEDPIEFLIRDDRAAITQREVGTDCLSFAMGLRNALRQDPDVIMVGEMRDRETVQTVITAAETGHLVLSTLHTNSAAQTLDRILDLFPGPAQAQIRMQLSQSLQAIASMQLVPMADGSGLTAAVEVMRVSSRIRKMLEEGHVADITGEIENSVSLHRMQSMDQSLVALVLTGRLSRGVAETYAHNPGDFDLRLRKHIPSGEEEDDMFPYCDYSKIVELDELRKLREDAEAGIKDAEQERNHAIHAMRDEVQKRDEEIEKLRATLSRGSEEFQRLQKQAAFMKQDYEARIQKLQDRVRQLSRSLASSS